MAQYDTYPKLLNGIEALLARDDLKTDIAGWVWLAEIQLQRALKIQSTEKISAGLSFVADQQYVTLPTDFLEARYIEVQSNPKRFLYPQTADRVTNLRNNLTDGQPRAFFVHGGRLELGPIPGSETYDLYYYGGLTHLSSSNATGYLLDKGADALFYMALLHSAPFLGSDERTETWGKFASELTEAFRVQSWNEKAGGGPLQIRPDVVA